MINDEGDLQGKLFYPLFQNHLGELIRVLGEHGLDESWAWKQVRRVCEETFRSCGGPFVEQDRNALFGPFWEMKRLAWMRLHDKVTEYTFSALINPMFRSEVERFQEELGEYPDLAKAYPGKIGEATKIVSAQLGQAMLREELLDSLPNDSDFREYLLLGCRREPELDWSTLYREIDNAVANLALILSYRELHLQELSPWDRIKTAHDSLQTSETVCLAGHNLHPCARTRIGPGCFGFAWFSCRTCRRTPLKIGVYSPSSARWSTDEDR